jgi:hypothetical protein
VLAPNAELVVRVTYRARASVDDAPVLRHLRLSAESRDVPELPGVASVELAAQPLTGCLEKSCEVSEADPSRTLQETGDGNPGPDDDGERERDFWESRRD